MYEHAHRPSTWTKTSRKFGKQIQRQQLDLPEYAVSFLNYKALKKASSPLSTIKTVMLD
jgi:CDK inhibitor PHO81